MAKTKGRRSRSISVDMEGVESGKRTIPDGTYPAEIISVEEKESSEGNPMLALKWKTTGKKNGGVTVYDNISLLPQALWKLKSLLEALGQEVPDSSMEIALDDLEGAEANLVIANEKYEGRDRPKVIEYVSPEDASDDDDDDTSSDADSEADDEDEEEEDERPGRKPAGKKPARNGKKPAKDEDEDEEEEDEDEEEDDLANRPRAGQRVKFKDEKGKLVKGKITAIEDEVATVKDTDGDEWEIDLSELTVIS